MARSTLICTFAPYAALEAGLGVLFEIIQEGTEIPDIGPSDGFGIDGHASFLVNW